MPFNRINIRNRENLTLLAMAYLKKLFIKSRVGEIYYDEDEQNEIRFIYFESNYYSLLIKDINSSDKQEKISYSKDAKALFQLLKALNDSKIIDQVDYGKLKLYNLGETNYSVIEIPEERLEKVLSLPIPLLTRDNDLYDNIEQDLKRVYIGMDIEIGRFCEGRAIIVNVPFKTESIQRFPFKSIIKILKKYNQEIENINIYKDANQHKFRISIKIDNRS